MNTNENKSIRENTSEDVVELGIASIETKGQRGGTEMFGPGQLVIPGISEE